MAEYFDLIPDPFSTTTGMVGEANWGGLQDTTFVILILPNHRTDSAFNSLSTVSIPPRELTFLWLLIYSQKKVYASPYL